MNEFGRLYRICLFGESHGKNLGVVIDGCPAGLHLTGDDFVPDLERRRPGASGTTKRREPDIPQLVSGVFNHRTTGAPITILFYNQDIDSNEYLKQQDLPRPGHADFTAYKKYGGFHDYRGSGHFSGRLTAPLVAAGVIAKKIVTPVTIQAELIEAGGSSQINQSIQTAEQNKDSIGGIVECRAQNLPPGLGEPFFDNVESMLSHIVFAVPGIKGIEFGSGFACSRMLGSECNDIFLDQSGKTATNNAGGVNGGITNGNELIFRAAAKPPSSIAQEQDTINLKTGRPEKIAVTGRHDVCFAVRLPVVIEAVTATVLADLMLHEHQRCRITK